MKNFFTKEVKIALVTIATAIILFVGIDFLKGINIMKPTNYYYINYTNVAGLTVSSPVTIDGFNVGLVRAIEYDFSKPGNITVEISLDKKLKVPSGSKAIIQTDFLGTATVSLTLNKYVSEFHTPGDQLIGENAPDLMGSVQNDLLPQLAIILPRIDSILISINTLVSNPALNNSLTRIDGLTTNLENSSKKLDRLMGREVPTILRNFSDISNNLNTFSLNIKEIDLKKTMTGVDSTFANLQELTDKLNRPDNTVGLLLNDNALYYGLTNTVNSADSLLVDLRKNPKRYVHFSLFGKK